MLPVLAPTQDKSCLRPWCFIQKGHSVNCWMHCFFPWLEMLDHHRFSPSLPLFFYVHLGQYPSILLRRERERGRNSYVKNPRIHIFLACVKVTKTPVLKPISCIKIACKQVPQHNISGAQDQKKSASERAERGPMLRSDHMICHAQMFLTC